MNCNRGQGRLLCKECCRVEMQEISLRMGFTRNGQDGNIVRQGGVQGR